MRSTRLPGSRRRYAPSASRRASPVGAGQPHPVSPVDMARRRGVRRVRAHRHRLERFSATPKCRSVTHRTRAWNIGSNEPLERKQIGASVRADCPPPQVPDDPRANAVPRPVRGDRGGHPRNRSNAARGAHAQVPEPARDVSPGTRPRYIDRKEEPELPPARTLEE
jgi:hypothetical protein